MTPLLSLLPAVLLASLTLITLPDFFELILGKCGKTSVLRVEFFEGTVAGFDDLVTD